MKSISKFKVKEKEKEEEEKEEKKVRNRKETHQIPSPGTNDRNNKT